MNEFFQYSDNEYISIGGGTSHQEIQRQKNQDENFKMGYYGLKLDNNLTRGESHQCDTYLNRTLSSTDKFIAEVVELWTFSSSTTKKNSNLVFSVKLN